jgi:antitoxin CptB
MKHLKPGDAIPTADRLRWQCRRGMLELDLLLEGFLDQGYDALSDEQKTLFVRVLNTEDQLLLDWLMGYVVPSDAQIRQMVERMRAGG